jgi:predicted TPR repeat methyltransferase
MTARAQPQSLQRVIELHKAGRLAEAEAGYMVLLRAHPDDGDVLHFLGMLRMHQGRRGAALALIRRSLNLLPANPHAWNNLANLLTAEERDDEAEAAYTRALDLEPKLAEAWFNLGVLFRRSRRPDKALESFRKVLESNPGFVKGYESLGLLLYRMGRLGDAAEVYRQWASVAPDNPIPRHMVAATSGADVPERATDQYVSHLFDSFAGSFDECLARLGYAAPSLLAAAISERMKFGEGRFDILDAGCGTGLCGVLLRSSAKHLVGVDLSSGMLAQARGRKIYDELIESELCACMRARPGAFDIVNCADTLVYFGALEEAAAAAATCLRPGGLFAFTAEAEPGDSPHRYRLQAHGRYTHRADYVRESLQAAGFAAPEIEPVVLRKERGEDVKGHLVVGRLPT